MSLPKTMQAMGLPDFGGPEVITAEQRPLPELADGQVLVKIAAAGVNGPDLVQRRGHYPPPPGASDLMGLEMSGEVVALGEGVKRWKVGDKICALTNGGSYAEYVTVDEGQCLPIPDGVSLVDAAGLPETFFTIWSNTFFAHEYGAGQTMLVHGGAGGIGSTAVQLGAAMGMNVFTTAGNPEAMAFCESLGAARAINYRDEDFVEVVKEAGGADLIIDIMGGDYINKNIKVAKQDALLVSLAFNLGAKAEVNFMPMMRKRLTLHGSTLRPRTPDFKAAVARDLETRAWPLFASGKLKAVTHATFPMDQAVIAHEALEKGGHRGKILLTM